MGWGDTNRLLIPSHSMVPFNLASMLKRFTRILVIRLNLSRSPSVEVVRLLFAPRCGFRVSRGRGACWIVRRLLVRRWVCSTMVRSRDLAMIGRSVSKVRGGKMERGGEKRSSLVPKKLHGLFCLIFKLILFCFAHSSLHECIVCDDVL